MSLRENKAGSAAENDDSLGSSSRSRGQDDHGEASHRKTMSQRAAELWGRTGITLPILKLIIKGGIAPTIALAAYQSNAWSGQYTTLGYLIGVMTQLSVVIQPRAKFLQTMLVQILLTCLAAALALLAAFCAVHARTNSEGPTAPGTGGPGTSGTAAKNAETSTYNSSASAVAGVWLFVEIYGISAFRAYLPQYSIPCVMFAIFANVSMTYAPQFNTMAQAEALVEGLLLAFLTGFALASGVSLLVLPVTSRELFFTSIKSFVTNLQDCLSANMTYLNSLEETDMFAAQKTNSAGQKPPKSPEAQEFISKMQTLSATHSKCSTELAFAKREVAFGKLGPDDLQQVFKLLREMTVPLVGLSSLSDVFERIAQESEWDRSRSFANTPLAEVPEDVDRGRIESINEWHELIRLLKQPFGELTEIIDAALRHILITLQLERKPDGKATSKDDEASGGTPQPGDHGFADYLDRKSMEFNNSKKLMLRGWCSVHGIELPEDYFERPEHYIALPPSLDVKSSPERVRVRRQLMVFLYVESLLYILSRRTLNMVRYANELQEKGKLSHSRLVFPGIKRLRKWVMGLLTQEDMNRDHWSDSFDVRLGQAYEKRKDPEHLPPQNRWERYTNTFRKLGRFFGSSASGFGLRAAVATMSIAIINYLKVSQVFFTKERLFWAQIITSIAMAPSAGQSLRTCFMRAFGTTIAMILAIVAWYIVDQKPAGVLVFYYIFQLPGLYIMTTRPTIIPFGLISTITLTLILGYELQVKKIGIQLAESNGQVYHPVYELAPIRLLTVVAGLFVATVFTLFPYPITEHSQLRENAAKSIYLLANYYSTVDETVKMRLKGGEEADEETKGTPGQKLSKARLTVFSKCNLLLAGMRGQASLVKYDIPCGGRFPRDKYNALIERVQSILSFISLISAASTTFTILNHEDEDKASRYLWIRDLRKVLGSASLTGQSVTTLLSLLSASLSNGQPLPPFLRTPEPYGLPEKLDAMDSELLSIRHVAEPGYASFAVIQIGLMCMSDDLKDLLEQVKDLVGELDFSYHILSTSEQGRHSDETSGYEDEGREGKKRSKKD